ncbi:MAG: transcriptional regulator [Chitinophagaceae bacterium]|nr:MAG: transcriptional regulator [Chitinophagaceae bacterium]
MLAGQTLNLNELAAHFPVSRPAISKHIRILTECGLVSVRAEGRERHCSADLKGLKEVAQWAAQYERFWNRKLDALSGFLQKNSSTKKSKK